MRTKRVGGGNNGRYGGRNRSGQMKRGREVRDRLRSRMTQNGIARLSVWTKRRVERGGRNMEIARVIEARVGNVDGRREGTRLLLSVTVSVQRKRRLPEYFVEIVVMRGGRLVTSRRRRRRMMMMREWGKKRRKRRNGRREGEWNGGCHVGRGKCTSVLEKFRFYRHCCFVLFLNGNFSVICETKND